MTQFLLFGVAFAVAASVAFAVPRRRLALALIGVVLIPLAYFGVAYLSAPTGAYPNECADCGRYLVGGGSPSRSP